MTTCNQLIRSALLDCGAIAEHERVSGQGITDALVKLNALIRSWQVKYPLWKRIDVTVFLNSGQPTYLLGPGADAAHWTESFTSTLLSGAHSAGATTLTLDSTSGMAVDDNIGIELSGGTRQWTTIRSLSPFRINTALTGAASDDATVFTYTARPQRPLRILKARRAPYNGYDVTIDIKSHDEYAEMPNQTTNGTPTLVAYRPTLTNGTLYVWQPSTVRNVLRLTVAEPFGELDANEDVEFPGEWERALTKNLAVELETSYRVLNGQRRLELRSDAKMALDEALLADSDGPTYFQPA